MARVVDTTPKQVRSAVVLVVVVWRLASVLAGVLAVVSVLPWASRSAFFLARYSRWAMASLVMDNGFPVRGLIGASVVVVSVVLVLSLIVVSGVSAMPPAYGVLGGLSVCVPPSPQGDMHACIHTYGHADMSVCRCVCV